MDLHGGRISVRSEGEGLGCTFTVDLPVYVRRDRPGSRSSSALGVPRSPIEEAGDLPEHPRHMPLSNNRSHSGSFSSDRCHSTHDMDMVRDAVTVYRHSLNRPQALFFSTLESPFNRSRDCLVDNPHTDPHSRSSGQTDVIKANSISIEMSSAPTVPQMNQRHALAGYGGAPVSSPDVMPIRVLVVDDAGLNRKMMCRLLKGYCQSVGEAYDGQDALAKVRLGEEENRPYNVILMDYQMPNLDGPGAARELRSNGYVGLIIGITGMTAGTDMEEFRAAGANCVLTKPVNAEDLDPVFQGKLGVCHRYSSVTSLHRNLLG